MGQLIIPDGAIVYVDTAPVIYSVETHPDYWALLQPLWRKSQANQINIISSELLLLETLVFPLRNKNMSLVAIYEDLFTDDIQLLKINQKILYSAAHLLRLNPSFQSVKILLVMFHHTRCLYCQNSSPLC